ncbi:MAG: hypothetical protein AB1791_01315 [Chloroflexota bacterium]
MRNSDPPRCGSHNEGSSVGVKPGTRNRLTHGFYSRIFTVQEKDDLTVVTAQQLTVTEELAATRVVLRRVAQSLGREGIEAEERERLSELFFRGVGAVIRLVQAQFALSDERRGSLSSVVGAILAELRAEWGGEDG